MRKMFVFVFAIMLIAGLMGIYSHQEASAQSNASCQISFETKLESDGWLRITPSITWQNAIVGDYVEIKIDGNDWTGWQTMSANGEHTWSPNWYSNESHEITAFINVVNEKTQCDSKTVYPVSAGIDPGVGGAAAPQGPDHGAGGASLWCIFIDGIGQLSAETIAADTRFKWRTPAEGGYLEFSNVWNAPWGTGPDGVARREVPVPSWENPVGTVFMYGTVCYYEPLTPKPKPAQAAPAQQDSVAAQVAPAANDSLEQLGLTQVEVAQMNAVDEGDTAQQRGSGDLGILPVVLADPTPVPETDENNLISNSDGVCPTYTGNSVVDCLVIGGLPRSYEFRLQIAGQIGINEYVGTAQQNTQMLHYLQTSPLPNNTNA